MDWRQLVTMPQVSPGQDINTLGAMQPVFENRRGNDFTDWLIGQTKSPHPVTQLMPSIPEVAQTMWQSGKNLVRGTGEALKTGVTPDPGQVTQDVMNVLPASGFMKMGSGLALAANQPKAAPWFSTLSRATETAKMPAASGEQWLGYLKNQPGVKPDELDWVGVPEWLKNQKGPVTKQDIDNFVKANQVDVQEVVKGDIAQSGINTKSKYYTPEVAHIVETADQGNAMDAAWLTLQNDGDAYRSLTRRFPELADDENWAETVLKDVIGDRPQAENLPKFSKWQIPGGENYRELLLTLPVESKRVSSLKAQLDELTQMPASERFYRGEDRTAAFDRISAEIKAAGGTFDKGRNAFTGGHYDEPNVLAHVRFNDRIDPNGKKTLFIEEVQSDWHQKGRKGGYVGDNTAQKRLVEIDTRLNEIQNRFDELSGTAPTEQASLAAEQSALVNERGRVALDRDRGGQVPDAPFKQSRDWGELSLKRMIKWAADNDYDQISWTPGKVQVERYPEALRQVATGLNWHADRDGFRFVTVDKKGGGTITFEVDKNAVVKSSTVSEANGKALEEVIGKPMAESIMAKPSGEIAGKDFAVGGKGMEDFYDKILVNAANKIGKKYGAKVGVGKIGKRGSVAAEWEIFERSPGDWTVRAKSDGFVSPSSWETKEAVQAEFIDDLSDLQEVWTLPITPELKEKALSKGMEVFTSGVPMGQSGPPQGDMYNVLEAMGNRS